MTEGLRRVSKKLKDDVAKFIKKPRSFFQMGSLEEQDKICSMGVQLKKESGPQPGESIQTGEKE